ncbi:MAG: hypothetical protein ACLR5S_06485, partial [Ruminococcus sp.]
SFSFFASFFLFSKEKKKSCFLNPPVSYADIPLFKGDKITPLPCRASPLKEETIFAANAMKITKATPKTNIQKACAASTEKGKQKRLRSQRRTARNERFRRTGLKSQA